MDAAVAILSDTISSLPGRKELQIDSPRVGIVKRNISAVLEACSKEENKARYTRFSIIVLAQFRHSILESISAKTSSKRREQVWIAFGMLRRERLPALWKEFLDDIGCALVMEDPLFMELTNESLMEYLVKKMYTTEFVHHQPTLDSHLSKDEMNIIRYACGFVGMKLHHKFIKDHGAKAAAFVECIEQMRAVGPSSSLLEYTREWTDKVNRGGLFEVSDEAFRLFVSIEVAMRQKLESHLHSITENDRSGKDMIIQQVIDNCDVQFHWDMLSVDIPEEHNCLELLRHVVTLWLTIRGYSITKAWMEDYKSAVCTTTKGKKGLRKQMKKQGTAETSASQ